MNSSESASAVLGLFLFLQLAGFLALLLGGFYVLNCLSRMMSSLERLADAAEERLLRANVDAPTPSTPTPVAAAPVAAPVVSAPPRTFPVVSGKEPDPAEAPAPTQELPR